MIRDQSPGMIIGFTLGVILMAIGVIATDRDRRAAREALYKCEKSLPRDQHCKVIAVPQGASRSD